MVFQEAVEPNGILILTFILFLHLNNLPVFEKQSELLKKLIYKKLSISWMFINYSEHLKCLFPYLLKKKNQCARWP